MSCNCLPFHRIRDLTSLPASLDAHIGLASDPEPCFWGTRGHAPACRSNPTSWGWVAQGDLITFEALRWQGKQEPNSSAYDHQVKSKSRTYLPLCVSARYSSVAAPATLLARVALTRFRRGFDNVHDLTFEEELISISLDICQRTKYYFVCLFRKLMRNKALHTTKEKLWQ